MAACKRFDYAGIAVMITGSFIPWLHYAFYCQPVAKTIYMVVFPITGLSVAAVTLWPIMGTPAYRGLRSAIFVVFGLSSIVPYIHWSLVQDSNPIEISLIKSAMVGVFYIGGAALYANRIPERLIPGKVDYWFQSHQVMSRVQQLRHFTDCDFDLDLPRLCGHRRAHPLQQSTRDRPLSKLRFLLVPC